jgi:integrase
VTRSADGRFATKTAADLETQLKAKQAHIEARAIEQKGGRQMLSLGLDPLFCKYISELRDVRARDSKTVKRNEAALRRLSGWLEGKGLAATDADKWTLNEFFVSLREELAPSTLDTELTTVRAAYRWAKEEELIPDAPRITFETGCNGNVEEPTTFTNEQLRKVRSMIKDNLEELIFYLLAYTGMRRFEMCGLAWGDVDFERRELWIRGKGSKGRRVPIHPVLYKLLLERSHKPEGETVLGPGGSPRNVNHRLGILLKRAGVDGGNRPAHAFRKTVTSVLTEEGVNPTDIDKIMGWSPATVRERYYTRTNPNLGEAMAKLYRSDPIEQRPAALVAMA